MAPAFIPLFLGRCTLKVKINKATRSKTPLGFFYSLHNIYTYNIIYIYIYILYISTALMRPRRPKQYCLQLVIYIYRMLIEIKV